MVPICCLTRSSFSGCSARSSQSSLSENMRLCECLSLSRWDSARLSSGFCLEFELFLVLVGYSERLDFIDCSSLENLLLKVALLLRQSAATRSNVRDHLHRNGDALSSCFVFILRRRRGSVTTRTPRRYWCVYDYEGTLKQVNNTFHTRAKESTQRIENSLRTINTTRWRKGKEGTPSFHKPTMSDIKIF